MGQRNRLQLILPVVVSLFLAACKEDPPPSEQCKKGEGYSALVHARSQSGWPYDAGVSTAEFWNWFSQQQPRWQGQYIYFDHLNATRIGRAQLDKVTLTFQTTVFHEDEWELQRVRISMNGYNGVALSQDAIEARVLRVYPLSENLLHPKGKKEFKLIEVKFHLEKFVFGHKHSAAGMARLAANNRGTVHFKIAPERADFRWVAGQLLLSGSIPGECTKPNPAPAPVVKIDSTSVGALTKLREFEAHFSANLPSTFECSLDGANFSTCTSPFTANNLADGQHIFSVKAISQKGSSSFPAIFEWQVDGTAPVVTLDPPEPSDPVTNQTQIKFSFTANESATFECQLNQGAWGACGSPLILNGLGDGQHLFAVRATDLAGNLSGEVTHSWRVKTIPPTVMITRSEPVDNPSRLTERLFHFEGSADTVEFLCALDNAAPAPCTSPHKVQGLADGSHQFFVWGLDQVGNQSEPATYGFNIDTVAPRVLITSIVPSQPVTNLDHMEFAFSADESVSFSCSLDGASSAPCVSPVVYTNLPEGSRSFSVQAKDPAGNVSAVITYSWEVDLTPPVVSLVKVNPEGDLINQDQISLQFSASEPAAMICTLDGASADCSSGTVSYDGLSDGNHEISIRATDEAGNKGPELKHRFTVDTTKPVVSIDSVNPKEPLTRETSITVQFSFSEDIREARCRLDSGASTACQSPLSISKLADGAHVIEIVGVDKAGNLSVPTSYSWVVDTTPPVTQIVSPPPYSGSSSITISFGANEEATFECFLDGVGPQPCTSPVTYNGLADGTHGFAVFATDRVGNRDNNGRTVSWTINTEPYQLTDVRLAAITRNSVTLAWSTNIPAESTVYIAPASTGVFMPVSDSTAKTEHAVTVTGLSPFTLYIVYVSSTNVLGQTLQSAPQNFRTLR